MCKSHILDQILDKISLYDKITNTDILNVYLKINDKNTTFKILKRLVRISDYNSILYIVRNHKVDINYVNNDNPVLFLCNNNRMLRILCKFKNINLNIQEQITGNTFLHKLMLGLGKNLYSTSDYHFIYQLISNKKIDINIKNNDRLSAYDLIPLKDDSLRKIYIQEILKRKQEDK